MTKRTVLLIRHGKPSLPDVPPLYGSTDLPLSPEGRDQSIRLSNILNKFSIDGVFSSPLIRSVETARLSIGEPVIEKDLSEIDLGSWEMKTKEELQQERPRQFEDRWRNIFSYRTPDGETFQELCNRSNRAFKNILKTPGNIAIFSHAGVFRTILHTLFHIDFKSTFQIEHDYCGIHILKEEKGLLKLTASNVTWQKIESFTGGL